MSKSRPYPVAAKGPTPGQVPPYRPRITTSVNPEPIQKTRSQWGSGWGQRGGGGASSNSWGSSGTGGSTFRRTNSNGPPTWVSPDVADSKANWRNSTRRTSNASTSPVSPRSPGGGRSSSFGFPRSAGDTRKGGFGSGRAPSSAASQSERDTSTWESASNATDTTWTNRFAMLDGGSTVDDGEVSDTSEGMDGERLREMAGSVITQDDDDDFASLVSGPSGRWQQTGPIKFVEIGEAEVKRSGLIKNRQQKMYRCIPHNAAWTLYVHVPIEEEEAV